MQYHIKLMFPIIETPSPKVGLVDISYKAFTASPKWQYNEWTALYLDTQRVSLCVFEVIFKRIINISYRLIDLEK